MMNYVIGQMASINIADIYSKDFLIDIFAFYSTSSPVVQYTV